MSTQTKTMSKEAMLHLKKTLDAKECKTPPYALYQIKTSDCTITAYLSGKVVFQGEGADFYAQCGKETTPTPQSAQYPQCGSDEVGTGDYFGPVVVCATCVEEKHLPLLKQLHIQDSKQLKDEDIQNIAPQLMEVLTYSLLVLDNAKYNLIHESNNMNAIKAKLHNQAFIHLLNKLAFPCEHIIIDQFTPEKSYYRYLQSEKQIVKPIHFETKAENKYLSVACGSIIARYTFLEAMKQMSKQYAFAFPKGAGANVDQKGVAFVQKYDFDTLKKVSKFHFKNTDKIKEQL
ncbi:MAG: ribonuclease HIII [Erysipelotrichia bacterium]|nr:ribonuclease HIII [Erysipelotrichia bacterium]NCC53967.1 ribonuclease HIII [Erysipelotrichia bacterium]